MRNNGKNIWIGRAHTTSTKTAVTNSIQEMIRNISLILGVFRLKILNIQTIHFTYKDLTNSHLLFNLYLYLLRTCQEEVVIR